MGRPNGRFFRIVFRLRAARSTIDDWQTKHDGCRCRNSDSHEILLSIRESIFNTLFTVNLFIRIDSSQLSLADPLLDLPARLSPTGIREGSHASAPRNPTRLST